MKIGFAFLIYKSITNHKYYETLFTNLKSSYEIAVHSKLKTKSTYNFNYIETPWVDTSWGSPSLVTATTNVFEQLFNNDCDIVYLLSGDMIPTAKGARFIDTNTQTTFQIDQNSYKLLNKIKSKSRMIYNLTPRYQPMVQQDRVERVLNESLRHYNNTSRVIRQSMSLNHWNKQNMFFCITKNDFEQIQTNNMFEKMINKPLNIGAHDEHYWVNAMNYLNIRYNKNSRYLYCNSIPQLQQKCQPIHEHCYHAPYQGSKIKTYNFIRKVNWIVPNEDLNY